MILSLKINDLSSYLIKQIKSSFPDNKNINESFVKKSVSNALDKIELCFEKINLPYYKLDNKVFLITYMEIITVLFYISCQENFTFK